MHLGQRKGDQDKPRTSFAGLAGSHVFAHCEQHLHPRLENRLFGGLEAAS